VYTNPAHQLEWLLPTALHMAVGALAMTMAIAIAIEETSRVPAIKAVEIPLGSRVGLNHIR
jgi:hypothetical protein